MKRRKKLSKTQKQRLMQIGKWVGLSSLAYESFMLFIWQRQHKRDAFNLALQKQAATKKPLAVVGDPGGDVVSRLLGNDYDCADLCIDPKGCASCAHVMAEPVDSALSKLGSGSHIVFVAPGILERVPDARATLEALQRVSGGDLFIAHKNPWTLLSLFGKRRILSAPPTTDFTEWRDLPWMPGPSKRERLGAASNGKSLWPLALGLGTAGAFVGYNVGEKKLLPALAGAAAGTATAAVVFQQRREEAGV